MADKRDFPDNDNRKISIDDDYIELIDDGSVEDIFGNSVPDVIEIEPEDIFSDSSNDVYIGRRSTTKPSSNDVYVAKRKSAPAPQQRKAVNSQTSRRTAPQGRPQQATTQYAPRQAAQQQVRNRQAQQQANMRRVNDKFDTQKIRRVDSEEISDFEARRQKLPQKGGAKRKKSPAAVALVVILAVIIGFGGIVMAMANSVVGRFNEADPIEHIEDVDSLRSESHVRNILLIGADAERGGYSRSDSIMIASVNKQTGRITVCSILRDTHVAIPGNRESKINAAYSWGGANLLIQTVEQNFGIRIDDYAKVDFEMFTALVDGLGGIEVDVSENEADYINNRHKYGKEEKPEEVPSGDNVHLTGYQALWYARIRKLDDDFHRTERQRKVISAIVEDVKGQLNPVGVFGLVSTAQDVAPYITTTLSTGDFWSLMFSLMSCMTKSGGSMDELLVTQQIPFDDTWWYSNQWDGSSISIDVEANREKLQALLYDDYEIEETSAESEDSDY